LENNKSYKLRECSNYLIPIPKASIEKIREIKTVIIDTHTHFYDPTRPEGVPWPNPNDEVLYRRVLPDDYKTLAVPEGVTGTVVVEASKWVADNQWILDLAADEPFIVGFVGHLEPDDPDFATHLNRFSVNPLFRGIRLGGGHIQDLENRQLLTNIEKLATKDLELDLLTNQDLLPNIASLAERFPELRIVINHVAGVRIDGNRPNATWVDGMHLAAANPNVYCKVSGLVESAHHKPSPDDVGYYAPTLDTLWDVFGEERLIYGSNWPVSERFADYATVQRIVTDYFAPMGDDVAAKYFWKNAAKAYKLTLG
jgi:L-fuconolactonase